MSKLAAGWHPEDIKAAIRKKFGTQGLFAAQAGVSASVMAKAVRQPISAKLERAISDAIDIPLHTLWPDRWLPDGRRIGRTERSSNSSADGSAHRQIGRAA